MKRWAMISALLFLLPAAAWAQEPAMACDKEFTGPSARPASAFYFASACSTLPADAGHKFRIVQKVCSSADQNVWFKWMPLNFRSSSHGTGPRACLTQDRRAPVYSLRQNTSLSTPSESFGPDAYLGLLPPGGQVGDLHSETSLVLTEEAGEPSAFSLRIEVNVESDSYATSTIRYDAETGSFVLVLPPDYRSIEALEEAGIVQAGGGELKDLFRSASAVIQDTYGSDLAERELSPVIDWAALSERSALTIPAGGSPLEMVGEGSDAFDRMMAVIENSLFCVVLDGFLSCETVSRERRES